MKRSFQALAHTVKRMRSQIKLRRIRLTLLDQAKAFPHKPETLFELLQKRFSPAGNYGYDAYSTWERGFERARNLLKKTGLTTPGIKFFEAGCGDGMVGKAMDSYGHEVMLSDLDDWRDSRVADLAFLQADLGQRIPIPDDQFDLIVSYNTFEHLQDPAQAFRELYRICKPGGMLYIDFGPLYCSPWGLHAYHSLHMPYLQFLFSENFIRDKLHELGFNDLGKTRDDLQPLNRWRSTQFEHLFKGSEGEIVSYEKYEVDTYLSLVLEYPWAFQQQELTIEDLTTQALRVLIRKN